MRREIKFCPRCGVKLVDGLCANCHRHERIPVTSCTSCTEGKSKGSTYNCRRCFRTCNWSWDGETTCRSLLSDVVYTKKETP